MNIKSFINGQKMRLKKDKVITSGDKKAIKKFIEFSHDALYLISFYSKENLHELNIVERNRKLENFKEKWDHSLGEQEIK